MLTRMPERVLREQWGSSGQFEVRKGMFLCITYSEREKGAWRGLFGYQLELFSPVDGVEPVFGI